MAFAERLLFGRTLADKLAPLSVGEEGPSSRRALPSAPGRPPELAFHRGAERAVVRSIADDRDRGRLLHAFANHELLAVELFALALLKFPDAPARLRRTWVATIGEEQRHLAAYLDRLASTGTALGDEPVSAHFWDVLSPIDDPLSFVVGMGLVLEQANLDFAEHWRVRFAAAGDPETAAVLQVVHDDEIRHVRLGLRWMRELGARPGEHDWDLFVRATPPGLPPARARGPALDRDARRRAGLDDRFVRELEACGGSRGRVPRLFLFGSGVEDELAGRPARGGVDGDLALLPMLLADREDVVLAPRPPVAFLASLAEVGLPVPDVRPEPPSKVASIEPWSWSPSVCARFASLGAPAWTAGREVVFGKPWAAERLSAALAGCLVAHDPDDVGVVCADEAAVERALADGRERVVKAALSTSGGHRVRVAGALDERARTFVRRACAEGPVVVEPWLDVVAELSVHGVVASDGTTRVLGVTRFGARAGVFRGVVLGPPHTGLPADVVRFLNGDGRPGRDVRSELERVLRAVGAAAAGHGHLGPLSIDALVVRGADGSLRLKPIGEVNPRCTMGRLGLALRERLAPTARGVWAFLPVAVLRGAGMPPGSLVHRLQAALPLALKDGRAVRAAFATTDPAAAKRVATIVAVAPGRGEVQAAFDEVLRAFPAVRAHLSWAFAESVGGSGEREGALVRAAEGPDDGLLRGPGAR